MTGIVELHKNLKFSGTLGAIITLIVTVYGVSTIYLSMQHRIEIVESTCLAMQTNISEIGIDKRLTGIEKDIQWIKDYLIKQ